MQIKSTVINNDGTYTCTWTYMTVDANGNSVEMIAQIVTRAKSDLNTEITNVTNRISDYQNYLSQLNTELSAVIAAGG